MRSQHAAILLVALAALLGLSVYLVLQDGTSAKVASAAPDERGPSPGDPLPGSSELVAPDEEGDDENRRIAPVEPARTEGATAQLRATPPRAGSSFLAGRVVDPWNGPVKRAKVYAAGKSLWNDGVPLEELDPERMPWVRRSDTETDDEGRFRIEVPNVAEARIAVRASGFVPLDGEFAVETGAERDLGVLQLEASVVLAGRVIDSAGRGVAGAEIRRVDDKGLDWGMMANESVLLATSDDAGRFKVDQLAAGPWALRIHSEEHPEAIERGSTDRPGATVSNLEFVLEDGHPIEGRVIGAPGDVLADLQVVAAPDRSLSESSNGPRAPRTQRRAECASDGSFIVRGLRKGERYRLQGRVLGERGPAAFFGRSQTAAVVAAAGDRGVELPYRPETALVFQVVDGTSGEPLTAFEVAAGTEFPMPQMGEGGRRLREHPEGRVRFAELRPASATDRVHLRVQAVGYETYERTDVVVREGEDTDLGVIRLARAPMVTVRVLDEETGRPVKGARVRLNEVEPAQRSGMTVEFDDLEEHEDMPVLGGSANRARTDDAGVARVTSLPGRKVTIGVRAEGHAPYRSEEIALPESKDYEHEVRIGPGGTVVVHVVDGDGDPVGGTLVQHRGPDGPDMDVSMQGVRRNVSDARGEVVFESLPPGLHGFRIGGPARDGVAFGSDDGEDRYSVVRMARGGPGGESEGWQEVEVASNGHQTVTLVAPERAELAGRVTEGGAPLAGARISLVAGDGSGEPDLPGFMGGGGGPEARTGGAGDYRIADVEVGEYRARVTHPSRAMPYETSVRIEEGANDLDLDLPVSLVAGRVTNSAGDPLPGIRVRPERSASGERRVVRQVVFMAANGDAHGEVFEGDDSFEPVFTDEEGRYQLRGVETDVDLVIRASGKGVQEGESKPVKLAPGDVREGVDVALEAGGNLVVQVDRADGTPGSMCMIQATFEGGSGVGPKNGFTNASGKAELTGLKPGKWRLDVTPMAFGGNAPSAEVPDKVVEVVGGDNPPTRFQLP